MLIDYTGFCMGQMDTEKCFDCPTLKECLVLYGKDQVIKVLEQIATHGNGSIGSIADDIEHRKLNWHLALKRKFR